MKVKIKSSQLPESCPVCKAKGRIWGKKLAETEQLFRDEVFQVSIEKTICNRCHFAMLDDHQAFQLVQETRNAYRRKHGLLTAAEIVERRTTLGKSQQEFADFLGVGVASIKRWEKGLVQDRSSDQLIRAKTAVTEPSFKLVALSVRRRLSADCHGGVGATGRIRKRSARLHSGRRLKKWGRSLSGGRHHIVLGDVNLCTASDEKKQESKIYDFCASA